jgi:hypothetical protein
VLCGFLASASQGREWKGELAVETITQSLWTFFSQYSHYSKSMRKQSSESIKAIFIFKPLEIIITLEMAAIYSEIQFLKTEVFEELCLLFIRTRIHIPVMETMRSGKRCDSML